MDFALRERPQDEGQQIPTRRSLRERDVADGSASLNMPVYEAMACGSLVLTDDRSDASALFKEDDSPD